MNIVSFSGGKDSTAMLLMMLVKGITVDRIICVDTTKEFPAMYRHIKKVYNSIATCFVDPYPISIMWGKQEYANTIIVKLDDLKELAAIKNPEG